MKRKSLCLIIGCLMVAALLSPWNLEAKTRETPKYGGVYAEARAVEPLHFDEASLYIHTASSLLLTNEDLLKGDWSKGPSGTGEVSWLYHWPVPERYAAGCLAESWKIDGDTATFNIRKGVRWHNKPPVNGRELTAEDVVFSLKRVWTIPSSYTTGAYRWETHIESMEATDKHTFVLKCKPGKLGLVWAMATDHHCMVPKEVYPEDKPMTEWEKTVGTGPFMLEEYVPGSVMTFKKNPDYWGTDPFFPENHLPYVDGVKWYIIPDASTRQAALRTARIDWMSGINWEHADHLKKTNPELKSLKFFDGHQHTIFWRLDRAPYNDVRVRRALGMAIDNKAIADKFYGGEAVIVGAPIPPTPEFSKIYIPVEKLEPETRKLYEYHPEEAKRLLAEAGYPDGFKTEAICYAAHPYHVDFLTIVKEYWGQVGVDLKIDIKEYAVWTSMGAGPVKTYPHMFACHLTSTNAFRFVHETPGKTVNYGLIDDPKINEAYEKMIEYWYDYDKQVEIYQKLLPYSLSMHLYQQIPTPYNFTFWQPWIKGYNGEYAVGYANFGVHPIYLWYDKDMRQQMTGKK